MRQWHFFYLLASIIAANFFFNACQVSDQSLYSQNNLAKVRYNNEAELQNIRDTGADLIVIQPDYVILRSNGSSALQSLNLETFEEQEMIQRLIRVALRDSGDVQKIVDSGADFWDVEDSSAIVRAHDYYIEKLQKMGFTISIIANNASRQGGDSNGKN